jgi:hypothetical protein
MVIALPGTVGRTGFRLPVIATRALPPVPDQPATHRVRRPANEFARRPDRWPGPSASNRLAHWQAVEFVPVTGTNAKRSSQASALQQLTTSVLGRNGEDRSPGLPARCTIPFAAYRVFAAIIASSTEMEMLAILLFRRRSATKPLQTFWTKVGKASALGVAAVS